jgi:hypothetical protein
MALVYGLHRKNDNAIRYIGITSRSIDERFKEHLSDAANFSKYPVHKWINKYQDVTYAILHNDLTFEQAVALEQQEIAARSDLLNLTNGGEGVIGYKHSDEVKQLLSKLRKNVSPPKIQCPACQRIIDVGNAKRWHFEQCGKPRKAPANKGIPMSDAQRLLVSKRHKGKTISEEHKQASSNALKGIQKPKVQCPNCKKIGGKPVMTYWHFDNCKVSSS